MLNIAVVMLAATSLVQAGPYISDTEIFIADNASSNHILHTDAELQKAIQKQTGVHINIGEHIPANLIQDEVQLSSTKSRKLFRTPKTIKRLQRKLNQNLSKRRSALRQKTVQSQLAQQDENLIREEKARLKNELRTHRRMLKLSAKDSKSIDLTNQRNAIQVEKQNLATTFEQNHLQQLAQENDQTKEIAHQKSLNKNVKKNIKAKRQNVQSLEQQLKQVKLAQQQAAETANDAVHRLALEEAAVNKIKMAESRRKTVQGER